MNHTTTRDRNEMALAEIRHQYASVDQATEATLVAQAQAGDTTAAHRLYRSVSSLGIKKAEAYHNRDTTAEHLGEMYFTFLNAVQTFDPAKGFRFTTWFGCKAGFATQESLRQKGKRKQREAGEILKECRRNRDAETGEATHKEIRSEANPWFNGDPDETFLKAIPTGVSVAKLMGLFPQRGKECQALAAMAKGASQADLAREWCCTRQNVSNLVSRISRRAMVEFIRKGCDN